MTEWAQGISKYRPKARQRPTWHRIAMSGQALCDSAVELSAALRGATVPTDAWACTRCKRSTGHAERRRIEQETAG